MKSSTEFGIRTVLLKGRTDFRTQNAIRVCNLEGEETLTKVSSSTLAKKEFHAS